MIIYSKSFLFVVVYSGPMKLCLPYSDFRYLPEDEKKRFDKTAKTWDVEGEKGCFITANLKIPPRLHALFDQFPFFVEKQNIEWKDLSDHMKKLLLRNGQSEKNFNATRLVATLHDKIAYNCHFALLKVAIDQGVEIDHIYEIVEFTQKPFLSNYIDLCYQVN